MNFLKNKLLTIILVLCLVFTIVIGITANNKNNEGTVQGVITSTITPIQRQFYNAGQRITNMFHFLKSISSLKRENEELKAQVNDLKGKLVDYEKIKAENIELNKLLQFKNSDNYTVVSANVIGKLGDNWFNMLLIDVGSKEGIKKGQYVRCGEGLVGKVVEVGIATSKVMTVLDGNFKIPVIINETSDEGLFVSSSEDRLCKVTYLPSQTKTQKGNIVITNNITSDLDVVVPKGIIIGTVESLEDEKINLSKTAYIKPAVDFSRLNKVQVIIR